MQALDSSRLIFPVDEEVKGTPVLRNLDKDARFFVTLADQGISQRLLRLQTATGQIEFASVRTASFVNDKQTVRVEADSVYTDSAEEHIDGLHE